jgi:hypothetical protein
VENQISIIIPGHDFSADEQRRNYFAPKTLVVEFH